MIPRKPAVDRRLFLVLLLAFVTGCASGPPARHFPDPLPTGVPGEIADVPFHPQDALQCGPAALATVLGWSDVRVSPAELEPYLFLPERGGSLQAEIKAQARRHGRIAYEIPPDPAALLEELAAGNPVLVLQNNGLSWLPAWHYAVVVGMSPDGDRVRLRSGTIRNHGLARKTFLRTWHRAGYWGIAVLPPDRMPASVAPLQMLTAINDFARLANADDIGVALRHAVQHNPGDVGLRFALANHFYSQGNRDRAEREYRTILAFASDAVMARNNLAWLLAERGEASAALALLDAAEQGGSWQQALLRTRRFAQCRLEEENEICEADARATEGGAAL